LIVAKKSLNCRNIGTIIRRPSGLQQKLHFRRIHNRVMRGLFPLAACNFPFPNFAYLKL
jgi:hypothetical protein